MSNLQNSIESILIKSNMERVDDEVSNKGHHSSPQEEGILTNALSSFNKAHVSEEESKELIQEKISNKISELQESDTNTDSLIPDRINYLIKNSNYDDTFMSFISEKTDVFLCNKIANASRSVSKLDINLKIIDPKELSVYFDENVLVLSPKHGGFIDGNEIIYIDYSDQQVDFLILRNIESGLKDITNQYKVILNNELVPFS